MIDTPWECDDKVSNLQENWMWKALRSLGVFLRSSFWRRHVLSENFRFVMWRMKHSHDWIAAEILRYGIKGPRAMPPEVRYWICDFGQFSYAGFLANIVRKIIWPTFLEPLRTQIVSNLGSNHYRPPESIQHQEQSFSSAKGWKTWNYEQLRRLKSRRLHNVKWQTSGNLKSAYIR